MKEYMQVGAVVLAIAGREKGDIFIVSDVQGDYVYLVNGKTRCLDMPKKKNIKHLHLLCKSENAGLDMANITDIQIFNFLKLYSKSRVK